MRVLLELVNKVYPNKRIWFVLDSVSVHNAAMRNLFQTGGPGERHIIMHIPPKCSFLNAIEEVFAFFTFRVRELIGAVWDGSLRLEGDSIVSRPAASSEAAAHARTPINGAVLRLLVRMAADDVSPELLHNCVAHVNAFAEKCFHSELIDPKQHLFVASEYKKYVRPPPLPGQNVRRWCYYHLMWFANEHAAETAIPGITTAKGKRARSKGRFAYVDGKRYKLDPATCGYILAPIKPRKGKKRTRAPVAQKT